MDYRKHRKELLKDKAVWAEHEKLRPEYELARSILEQRLKKKLTQVEVAKKTGMPQSTIARVEGLPPRPSPPHDAQEDSKGPRREAHHCAEGEENGVGLAPEACSYYTT